MTGTAVKITRRVSEHMSGTSGCTPKGFLNLRSREAVDQALSRLAKAGQLHRLCRGMDDMTRIRNVLERRAPIDMDPAIATWQGGMVSGSCRMAWSPRTGWVVRARWPRRTASSRKAVAYSISGLAFAAISVQILGRCSQIVPVGQRLCTVPQSPDSIRMPDVRLARSRGAGQCLLLLHLTARNGWLAGSA